MDEFKGSINFETMSTTEAMAYKVWRGQKHKFLVEYSSREFIAWYVKNKIPGKVRVIRKDIRKPFTLTNIEMIEAHEKPSSREDNKYFRKSDDYFDWIE